MGIDRRALKRQAKADMRLPRPKFWAVTLLYIAMTAGVSILCSLLPLPTENGAPSSVVIFLSMLVGLYGAVVSFGYTLWALWANRHLNPGPGALVQGFSVAGRVILMHLLIFVRQFAFCFLAGLLLSPILLFPALAPLGLLALGAVYVIVSLRYTLAPYLLADQPDDGPAAAIRRSVDLMRGWKMELFKLELSFLGWAVLRWLLTSFALGYTFWYSGLGQAMATLSPAETALWLSMAANSLMAFALSTLLTLPLELWLTPYQAVTRAGFYNLRLRAQQQSATTMPPL